MGLLLGGCSLMPQRVRAPQVRAEIRNGKPAIEQKGSAEIPASAKTEATVSSVPIPAGSIVSVPPAAAAATQPVEIKLSAPSELRVETKREIVEGAKSFAPPAPPSPAELAKAQGIRWFYIAGAICAAGAVAAFVMGFPRMGVALAVGGVGMPLVGSFLGSRWALPILGAAGAAAFAYWHSWHVQKPVATGSTGITPAHA